MGFCEGFPLSFHTHKVRRGKSPADVPFQLTWWPGVVGFAPLDDPFAHAKATSHDLAYHRMGKRASPMALKQTTCLANIVHRVGLL